MADKALERFIGEGTIPDLWLRRHRRCAVHVLVLALAFALAGCQTSRVIYQPDPYARPLITASSARQMLEQALQVATNSSGNRYQDVRVTMTGFSLVDPGGANMPHSLAYRFDEFPPPAVIFHPDFFAGRCEVSLPGGNRSIWWVSPSIADTFAAAIQVIGYYSSDMLLADDAAAFAEFKEKAAAWRALPQKPEIPEDAHRYMVLFEGAFQKKEFDKAADYGEQGLAVCPLWPDMQFDAALVDGESGMYAKAICSMKRYLELCPDSPKARDARNKMYAWEEEVKRMSAAFVQESDEESGRVGLGVHMEEGKVKVILTPEGAPAFRAGVRPGDYIVSVDDQPIEKIASPEEPTKGTAGTVWFLTRPPMMSVALALRGPVGSTVKIDFLKGDTNTAYTAVLKREAIR